tara:strand:- start:478 stop:627 length:150 start_codon:yes stop_codon:yes gene_type:complete
VPRSKRGRARERHKRGWEEGDRDTRMNGEREVKMKNGREAYRLYLGHLY